MENLKDLTSCPKKKGERIENRLCVKEKNTLQVYQLYFLHALLPLSEAITKVTPVDAVISSLRTGTTGYLSVLV